MYIKYEIFYRIKNYSMKIDRWNCIFKKFLLLSNHISVVFLSVTGKQNFWLLLPYLFYFRKKDMAAFDRLPGFLRKVDMH